MATSIRIDERVRWLAITLVSGDRPENGPFWMDVAGGHLQAAQYIFVTNGTDAWPITAVVALEGASWATSAG